MLKRHLSLLLVLVLLLQLAGTAVLAADSTDELPDLELSFEETAPFDDPEYYQNMTTQKEDSLQSTTFSDFTPRSLYASEVLRKGIDVSYYQHTIDWQAVRNDGIDFAIIRVGYRGYGSGQLVLDPRFEEYMQKSTAAGIRVGVYIYSQAITTAEAVEEAQYILDRIKNYNVQLPLVIDFEFAESSSGYVGRLYNANLTKSQATAVCNAFISTVTKAGYRGMVYANKFMLEQHLNPDSLQGALWLAQYRYTPTYTGFHEFWQCSSDGAVSGISTPADIDFWFENTSAMPFLDVSPNRWSYASIQSAYEQELIFGITENKFGPTASTTRGQLVTILYRMNGSPPVTGSCPFTDLTKEYYKPAIIWAYQQGIVAGRSETTFAPEDPITRQDLISILYRMKKPEVASDSQKDPLSDFTDASTISGYASDAMAWGVSTGLLSGYGDNTLRPKGKATREEAVAFLVRYMNLA